MQLLIRIVDAQLLETVLRKVLEPENVQEPDHFAGVLARVRPLVDVGDEPAEAFGVEGPGAGNKSDWGFMLSYHIFFGVIFIKFF